MNKLAQYLAEGEIIHEFRLKIAKQPTDLQLDAMELHLRKYDGYDITTPKKTIIQRNPIDFKNIGPAEVYMIDFKTKQPISPHMLVSELSQKMDINESFIVLRNKNERMHIEDEADEIEEKDYVVKLTDDEYTDSDKIEVETVYGEEFKANFLKDLTDSRNEMNTEYKGKAK